MLKGYQKFVNKQVSLTTYGNPLSLELSSYWKDKSIDIKNLRNILPAKVYANEYDNINLRPVTISNSTGEDDACKSTEVCSKCRSVLHGENYILYGNIADPDSTTGVAICPICLHTSPADKAIEMKYFMVFRVTFPRTTLSLVELETDPELKDIYLEALKGLQKRQFIEKGVVTDYVEIGDKWLGFKNINDFIYSKFSTEIGDKKICLLSSLNLIE
jgi:hypothetical protein